MFRTVLSEGTVSSLGWQNVEKYRKSDEELEISQKQAPLIVHNQGRNHVLRIWVNSNESQTLRIDELAAIDLDHDFESFHTR